jgi:hypothetical protein
MANVINYAVSGETEGVQKASSASTGISVLSGGRGGRFFYRLAAGSNSITIEFDAFTDGLADPGGDYIVGFYVRFDDVTPTVSEMPFAQLYPPTSSLKNWELSLETDGDVVLRDEAGTLVGTVTAPFSINTWYKIEVWCVVHETAGALILFIDGIAEINASGLDTGADTDGRFEFSSLIGEGITVDVQDCYFMSGATVATERLSGSVGADDWEVIPFYGDGTSTTGGDALDSGTWANVQEFPTNDSNQAAYTDGTAQSGWIEADGSGSDTGPSGAGLGTIKGMGGFWRMKEVLGAAAAERLPPDAIITQTNLTGAVTDIDEDPDSPDANWLTASGKSVLRTSFGTPADTPGGVNAQNFRVLMRKSGTGLTTGEETLFPTALEASANYTGAAIGDFDDDPDTTTDYGNWDGNGNTDVRVSFGNPSGNNLKTGAGLQEFRIAGRKADSTGGNTPTYDVELWESGVLVSVLTSGASWPDDTGKTIISATWNASLLSDGTGDGVEVRIEQTDGATGTPGNRRAIEIGGIEWNVDYETEETVAYTIRLYEGGVARAPQTSGTLTAAGGDTVDQLTWDESSLGTADGSAVECRVWQTDSTPTVYLEIGAVEWNTTGTYTGATHTLYWGNDVDGMSAAITDTTLGSGGAYTNYQEFTNSDPPMPTTSQHLRVGMGITASDDEIWGGDMQLCILHVVSGAAAASLAYQPQYRINPFLVR